MIQGSDASAATYQDWLAKHRDVTTQATREFLWIESLWSWGRLLAFFAFVGGWYVLGDRPVVACLVAGATLSLFLFTIRRNVASRHRRELGERILTMADESSQRCGGKVVLIRDGRRPTDAEDQAATLTPVMEDGPTWQLTDQEKDDLDLYSPPVGLFGLLNRTSTAIGARRLRTMVENPCLAVDVIEGRQAMVRWLQSHGENRLRIMAALAGLRGQDGFIDKLIVAISGAQPLPQPGRVIVYRVWSAITAIIMLVALGMIGFGHAGWVYVMLLLAFANGMTYLSIRDQLTSCIEPFRALSSALERVLAVARQGEEDLPSSTKLAPLRDCLADAAAKSMLPRLCRIVPWVDTGGVFHVVANLLFFYDLHVAAGITKIVVPGRERLLRALAALADLDAMASLGAFASEMGTSEGSCLPKLVDTRTLQIIDGRHPLIDPAVAIPNSVQLDHQIGMSVVTGSNMAGKSTFLRMCGVNCLLAQMGSAVPAGQMTVTPVRLVTDLQVRDTLADGESYFLAEVHHLRRLVVPESGGGTMLGLIDEPFRGTNSEEQVAAALAVVEHLQRSQNFFLIATHEHQLATLAEECPTSENHHFRENLGADGLVFDYHIQDGPAVTRNALRVLEREGYPPELLERAREWLARGRHSEAGAADLSPTSTLPHE